MTTDSLVNEVISVITSVLVIPADTIRLTHNVVDDLQLDSLDVVDLVLHLEDRFDIVISDESFESWETVQDIVNTVSSKLP